MKINADYTSLITAHADGSVKKDDRLTNYTPGFKRALLVEALSYISRFSGRRAVLSYGEGAMSKDSLLASFARDINLLRSAGLLPIVMHGGGKDLAAVEPRGDGTPPERPSSRTIEMILTGRVNTELVSLLNHATAHADAGERGDARAAAIGLSGTDAGLFRAKKGSAVPAVINTDLLEMMLPKYVPVLSPVALGDDGESVLLDADAASAEVAVAVHADKLIYLSDVPGLLEQGELVTEIPAADLRARMDEGKVPDGARGKLAAGCARSRAASDRFTFIDGQRAPLSVIAELFTDTGVGTLLKRD